MRISKRQLRRIIREESRKLNNRRLSEAHYGDSELEFAPEFHSKTIGSFVSNTLEALEAAGVSPRTLDRVEDILAMAVQNAESEILRLLVSEMGMESLGSIVHDYR